MSGNLGGSQRSAGSDRTAVQKRPRRSRWWIVYCALLVCVVLAVWMRRTAPTEDVAPPTADVADDENKLRERGVAMLAAAQKEKLKAAESQSSAQTREPERTIGTLTGASDLGPNKSAAQLELAPGRIASPPEEHPSTPVGVPSLPEVQHSPLDQRTTVGQPEIQDLAQQQAPASNAFTRPTEGQPKRADPVATPSDTQRPRPEEALSSPEMQTSRPEPDITMRQSNAPAPRIPGHQGKDDENDGDADKLYAVPQLVLPDDVAQKVGHKIWLNETNGNRDAITSWNAGEEFASLGIGHFLWFPSGKPAPFEESFPPLIEFLRQQNVHLPSWIDKRPIPACPWTSRADFKKNFNSPRMKELRQFLLDTVAGQAQYLVVRAQAAMGKILQTAPDGTERAHLITQYSRVVQASKDLYPLIDYIEFKGEGVNPEETAVDKQTGKRQGWGLKQVLLKMNGTAIDPNAVLAEYADAAQSLLQQRVRNIPANKAWELGWLRRVDTYRRPLVDVDSKPKPARRTGKRK